MSYFSQNNNDEESKLNSFEIVSKSLNESYVDVCDHNGKLMGKIIQQQKQNYSLMKENKSLKRKIKSLVNEKKILKEENKKVEKEKAKIKNELIIEKNKYEQKVRQFNHLKATLTNTILQLKQHCSLLKSKLKKQSNEMTELKEKINIIQKQLSQI